MESREFISHFFFIVRQESSDSITIEKNKHEENSMSPNDPCFTFFFFVEFVSKNKDLPWHEPMKIIGN